MLFAVKLACTMGLMSLRPWSRPLFLLLLVTGLFTFLIQSGELGTSDTTHRLQVTHSLWTGQPQVLPNEYPEFGLHGRGGRLYAWYGIGQSLLMLPADLIGSAASHLPFWRDYVESQADPAIRSIFVSVSTNILVNVLTALAAFRLLELLGFSEGESVAGTLGLLCATTHLHYAQNMQENNYVLLLTITGFALQYKWLKTGDRRALFWGSAALGLNLLTRLTTILDLFAAGCFILLAGIFARRDTAIERGSRPAFAGEYLRGALPIYAVFLLLDRIYQYIRFGSWTNTYVAVFAREQRQMDPTLPANFPFNRGWFEGGLHSGILGPFFMPEKTIFVFDPLFVLMLLLTILLWKRLTIGGARVSCCHLHHACGIYRFLRALQLVGRRLCLGRSLYLQRSGTHHTAGDRAAAPLSKKPGKGDLVVGAGDHGAQFCHPVRIPGVLAAVGDLPDGNPRAPHLGCVPALQEHPGLRASQTGCLGTEYTVHVSRFVGCDAHHNLEFSALTAAPRGRRAVYGLCMCLYAAMDRGGACAHSFGRAVGLYPYAAAAH